jgi:hypothetical protein
MQPSHSAGAPRIELTARHERWVLGLGLALLASGAGWLASHYLLAAPDEFGASRDPLAPWWLRLHGAAAMGFLVVLGSLLPVHVRRAWQFRRNRASGAGVLALAAVLIASGYALYYVASEPLRWALSVAHWLLGLGGLPVLAAHVILGRRWAERRRDVRHRRRPPHDPRAP